MLAQKKAKRLRKKLLAQRKYNAAKPKNEPAAQNREIKIIIVSAIALFLELCLFGVLGTVGDWVRYAQSGLFGLGAYVFPILCVAAVVFLTVHTGKHAGKIVWGIVFFLFLCAFLHMVSFSGFEDYPIGAFFTDCAEQHMGGGIFGGTLAFALAKIVSIVGAYIVTILVMIVSLLIICEVPVITIVKNLFAEREYDDEDYEDYEEERRPARRPRQRPAPIEPRERRRPPSHTADAYYERNPEPVYDDRRMYRNEMPGRRPAYSDDELVYETTSDEGVVIKIVHSKKAHKRPRVDLKRSANKAASIRDDSVRPVRSQNKRRGVGDSELSRASESVDEIREITEVPPAEQKPKTESSKKAEHAPVAPVILPSETPAPPKEKKVARQDKKPADKITNATKISDEAPKKKKSQSSVPADVEVRKVTTAKKSGSGSYTYPPMSLLAQKKGKGKGNNNARLDAVARNLEIILENFGVSAKVIDRQAGPSVTRYELQPEMGTRVSKITSLEDDLKLNLAVSDIRIEAPIPGRAAIGIEIPNENKETVLMRELLEAPELINHKSKIAFAAGVDISGDVIVADIAKMPHLLVAGTTGSGKSTFINTIIMAILYRAKPSEVGLIIIDPKKIEFGVYSGIPHLVKDVVTDPGQAVSTLRWAVNEMTNRYQRMQLSGVRDFKSYNEKFEKGTLSSEEENPKPMPQIVIVIDELADLMMVASKEAEALICRLAQLARAAGIHLIIATQRPSVDVVTGLIKANIPGRVALLVASQVDSRTIIDMKGAEELLGYGDMLFYPTGYSKPVRVQGAYISEEEVANVVGFLKKNKTEDFFAEEAQQIEEYMNNAADGQMDLLGDSSSSNNANKQDEYLFEAGKLCIEMGKASSSMLQRHFSVGFNRAAKIIDQLTEMGAISQPNGAKPREILVDLYTFEEMFRAESE